ncbi:MAG: sigma-70 family RNA polymerase sigma factor [Verrucomicrobiia bacterium]
MTSDLDLLNQFARENSQAAFSEIVRRHLDLVYSAALRQVHSSQLAEDIAQSVFTDLARNVGKMGSTGVPPVSSLTPWLYAVTRRTAIDAIRKESRRQLREQIAVEMNTMNATTNDWTQIEPLLDEAMAALDETDRSAVLLRFFENKSLREIGEALGASEDAAQKRVSRAVERLREFFSKRNVTIGASGLAVLVSANAVQAAPVGLATTISAAAVLAGTAVHTSTLIAATKTIAMTTIQKTIIGAMLAAAIGTGIFEAHQNSKLQNQIQTLQQQQAPLAEQIRQLQQERDDATNQLATLAVENKRLQSSQNTTELLKLRGEVTRLQDEAKNPTDIAAKALVAKVNKLRQRLEETPGAIIPELQFLTEKDWLNAANGNLDTDADYRRALALLRSTGENEFVSMLKPALNQYMQANNGQFPTDLSQLQQYFASPVDDAVLQRWEITSPATVPNIGVGQDGIITEKAAVDDIFDSRNVVGSNGSGSVDFLTTETEDILRPVYKAFSAANNGQTITDYSQLLPYATTPEQQAAIQKWIQQKMLNN